jgi:ABC-type Fe3+/spermidine/putrescine transport system ATPase subunit
MDEPLGALDKKLREYMQIEIKRIQKETGITVMYVTHDQEEALNMSDKIAVMNHGKIEQVGSAREIYEQPKNQFIANFIGDANILEGYVSQVHGEIATVLTSHRTEVKASNLNEKAVDHPVHVVVRPERVKLLRDEPAIDNAFAGTVSEASYVGNIIRYIIDLDGGDKILLKEPNGGQGIHVLGKKVSVGWNWQDGIVV